MTTPRRLRGLHLTILAAAVARCGGEGASTTDATLALDAADEAVADAPLDAAPDAPLDVVLPPSPLTAREVTWNAAGADLGSIAALAEPEGLLVLFGQRGMQVLAGGSVSATDATVTAWRAAAVVPAGDGTPGAWTLGVADDGRLWRMRDLSRVEEVTGRYGLTMRRVRSVATLSENRVAFGYDGGFAIADGMRVSLWSDPTFADLVGAGGRLAARTDEGVRVFDVARGSAVMFPVAGVTGAAFDGDGRLVVTAGGDLYAETDQGSLVPRVIAGPALRGVVRSAGRVWLVAGDHLALWDGREVHASPDAAVPADGRLLGSPSGDVWVIAGGRLTRYGFVESPDVRRWEDTVRPVFARRCVPCHLPGGTGNADLTTYASWRMRRDEIRMRVLVERSMPPPPGMLTADERGAIGAWLDLDAGAPDASVDATADVRDATMDVPDAAADVRDATADVRDATTDVRDAAADAGPVTYAAVDAIVQRACVRCHGTSGGLNLSVASTAYTALVNAPTAGAACGGSGRVRVVPRDPMRSVLYLKLTGMQDCGASMPRGAAALPAADLDTVRRWIEGGALR